MDFGNISDIVQAITAVVTGVVFTGIAAWFTVNEKKKDAYSKQRDNLLELSQQLNDPQLAVDVSEVAELSKVKTGMALTTKQLMKVEHVIYVYFLIKVKLLNAKPGMEDDSASLFELAEKRLKLIRNRIIPTIYMFREEIHALDSNLLTTFMQDFDNSESKIVAFFNALDTNSPEHDETEILVANTEQGNLRVIINPTAEETNARGDLAEVKSEFRASKRGFVYDVIKWYIANKPNIKVEDLKTKFSDEATRPHGYVDPNSSTPGIHTVSTVAEFAVLEEAGGEDWDKYMDKHYFTEKQKGRTPINLGKEKVLVSREWSSSNEGFGSFEDFIFFVLNEFDPEIIVHEKIKS
jgi:hypothetical protein